MQQNKQFTEDLSEFKPWAFTLRKVDTKNPLEGHYSSIFKRWEAKKALIKFHVYEPNTNHQAGVHAHGIVLIPKTLYRKRLTPKGYHLHLTEVTDEKQWLKYCNKIQHKETIEYDLDICYL